MSFSYSELIGGSIRVSGLSVHTVTVLRYRGIYMLLISVEVSVKVACRSTTATDCSTELLILREVPVKVAYRSTTATDCRHRAITMLLILVEVSLKVACQFTIATDCSHKANTPLLILGEASV